MLETPEERVKLLKAGVTGDRIEKLYIDYNHIKMVRFPTSLELFEVDEGASASV